MLTYKCVLNAHHDRRRRQLAPRRGINGGKVSDHEYEHEHEYKSGAGAIRVESQIPEIWFHKLCKRSIQN